MQKLQNKNIWKHSTQISLMSSKYSANHKYLDNFYSGTFWAANIHAHTLLAGLNLSRKTRSGRAALSNLDIRRDIHYFVSDFYKIFIAVSDFQVVFFLFSIHCYNFSTITHILAKIFLPENRRKFLVRTLLQLGSAWPPAEGFGLRARVLLPQKSLSTALSYRQLKVDGW